MSELEKSRPPGPPPIQKPLAAVEAPLVDAEESLSVAEESLTAAQESLHEAKESLEAAGENGSAKDPLAAVEEPLVDAGESLSVAEQSIHDLEDSLSAAKKSLKAAEQSLSAEEASAPPMKEAAPIKPPLARPAHAALPGLPEHRPSRTRAAKPLRQTPPAGKSPVGPLIIGLIVVLAVVTIVLIPRFIHKSRVERATDEMATPTVTVLHPKPGVAVVNIVLPGNVSAYYDSPIYARTSGYLKNWLVDIGDKVHAGQLLAEIETPEVDQQLDQARAAQVQTAASLSLAQTTADRWRELMKQNAVAQQELDEKNGDLAVQTANLAAADANVKRLEALQSFEKVVAPFDGVITARETDIGALINAGSGTGVGPELFHIAQIDRLRVYVNVPEAYASSITLGTEAQLALGSAPGVPVTGKVTNISGAIDATSHTLLIQLEVPNQDGHLIPGGYAQVSFKTSLTNPPLIIPVNTLLFHSKGPEVGVVDSNNVVAIKLVKIGRDFGNTVEIVEGLKPSDNVILNPADSLQEGAKVRVQQQPAAAPANKK